MSYATILSSIKTAIEAVTGITGGAGVVRDFQPHVTRIEDFSTEFEGTTEVNGWTISRERRAERQLDDGFRFTIVHDIIVRGYGPSFKTGAADTEESTLQNLVDAVCDAIRGSVTIWVEHPEENPQAIQVEVIGPVVFGSVLVHSCEMRFSVEEVATISS